MTYASRLKRWRAQGYRIELAFLRLDSRVHAVRRVAARVQAGGHDVPREDVIRRFERGWHDFNRVYVPLADTWAVWDNSGAAPHFTEAGP